MGGAEASAPGNAVPSPVTSVFCLRYPQEACCSLFYLLGGWMLNLTVCVVDVDVPAPAPALYHAC